MRVLMCGDRNWSAIEPIDRIFQERKFPMDTIIIHGDARGADRLAGTVAYVMGYKVDAYPADWEKYGRAAGPIRNKQMLDSGIDLVIAFHNNIEASKGTADMVKRARKAGVEVIIITEDK